MTSLSEDDRKAVNDHSLNDSVDRFRKSLQDVERSYSVSSSLDGANDSSEHDCQKTISRLLLGLADTTSVWFGLVLVIHRPSRLLGSYAGLR
jgi:hypothetical protein